MLTYFNIEVLYDIDVKHTTLNMNHTTGLNNILMIDED